MIRKIKPCQCQFPSRICSVRYKTMNALFLNGVLFPFNARQC
jgi:hypothetical protein